MPPRRLPQILTADEVAALMARPNVNCPTGLRNRAILETLYRAGLRASEACGIHVRDLNWKTGNLRVRAEVAKYGHEATLYLGDESIEWLERWKHERRHYAAGKPWMFTTLKGGQLDRRYVWEMVSRYGRKAGLDHPIWPHLLRHTYATTLLQEQYSISEVQRLMRHSDLRTTSVYLHVHEEDLAERVRNRPRLPEAKRRR